MNILPFVFLFLVQDPSPPQPPAVNVYVCHPGQVDVKQSTIAMTGRQAADLAKKSPSANFTVQVSPQTVFLLMNEEGTRPSTLQQFATMTRHSLRPTTRAGLCYVVGQPTETTTPASNPTPPASADTAPAPPPAPTTTVTASFILFEGPELFGPDHRRESR